MGAVVVSMRKMSAGAGYKYLLRTVVAGDGDRSLSTPLTRYYAETGTPPGRWMGTGVRDLGLEVGTEVTETQLALLIGHGRHPVTGDQLGRAYPVYKKDPDDPKKKPRKAVAGFDYTFSMPKSASVLWAVADAGTQAIIADAHHAAVRDVVDFMERELAATRMGAGTPDGAVAQVETRGLIAAAYDHWDSRAGDPHLHTHVVISNKVLTARDHTWRSLDSHAMYAWGVSASELHQAVLADHLTRVLGVEWEPRSRGRDRNPDWAIASVPQSLSRLFSQRSADIDVAADEIIREYVEEHGHRPRSRVLNKIRDRASLATRPPKHVHSLAELTEGWRARGKAHLGIDATRWASKVADNPPARLLRADDVGLDVVSVVASLVLIAVGEKRSTWRRPNLYAEAARQTMGWRFATTTDREAITGMVVDAAEHASLRLTPPELASVPASFTRTDGTSVFRPRHSIVYSSEQLLAAEDRLLERADARTAPTVNIEYVDAITAMPVKGHRLTSEQAQALATIATDAHDRPRGSVMPIPLREGAQATSGRRLRTHGGTDGAGSAPVVRRGRPRWCRRRWRGRWCADPG